MLVTGDSDTHTYTHMIAMRGDTRNYKDCHLHNPPQKGVSLAKFSWHNEKSKEGMVENEEGKSS